MTKQSIPVVSFLFYMVMFSVTLSGFTAFAQQCGSQAGGALCAGGLCCSQWGWCGTSDAYCGSGCQSNCPTPTSSGQCGSQAGGALCSAGLCCSQWGWCGNGDAYCGSGCQSGPCSGSGGGSTPTPTPSTPTGGSGDITGIISKPMFEEMLKHRNDAACPAHGFYTYEAFIIAARSFPPFGTTGDITAQKREIAAFLAETSHETTGGWATAPDGAYSWGYCFKEELNQPNSYCVPSSQWPCAAGKKYYGRGPIQISYNYNYGPAGTAIGYDLLNNPDAVATDPVISFKTALWFWMTPQPPKPSCHNVITGQWTPSSADTAAGRVPGYGLLTNIINGGIECGKPTPPQVIDRIGFYKRYCDLLGVSYGSNLDCAGQKPY
ncbi:hypothetical protein SAY87_017231 [Trapa incisa]|uniref:Chitin-binding type-1 domain-containing protein n=1 Tax=Trapa incisa TaxID=236973 RepID=A0AAN7LA16_9MYRT|nr:hypothetical protein SAY87_017231 [Trapa incisa]